MGHRQAPAGPGAGRGKLVGPDAHNGAAGCGLLKADGCHSGEIARPYPEARQAVCRAEQVGSSSTVGFAFTRGGQAAATPGLGRSSSMAATPRRDQARLPRQ
jgi:hypothetical protein